MTPYLPLTQALISCAIICYIFPSLSGNSANKLSSFYITASSLTLYPPITLFRFWVVEASTLPGEKPSSLSSPVQGRNSLERKHGSSEGGG